MLFFILACFKPETDSIEHTVQSEFSGYVTQLIGGAGMEDISVCSSQCSTTDREGYYTLTSKEETSEHLLVMTGEDLVSGVVPVLAQSPEQTIPNVSLVSPVLIEAQMSMVDLTWEEGTGVLVFSISNGIFGDGINVPEVMVSMENMIGDGPFYTNAQGLPSMDLTETSIHGGGVWLNIPPGVYTFTPSNIPTDCTVLLGWGAADRIHVPIQAKHITFMRIECSVP